MFKLGVLFLGFLFGCSFFGNVYAIQSISQSITAPDTQYVNNLLEEASQDINHGQFPEATTKIKQAKQLSDSLDYMEGKALSTIRLAEVFLDQQKNDSVIIILREAIQLYPESKNRYEFYNHLGNAYLYKSEALLALEYYKKSLEEVSEVPEEKQARYIAALRLNMAGAYLDQGNKNDAFENYLEAVRFSEISGDTTFWVTSLNNIGNAYNEIQNYEEAEFYLEKAKGIAESQNLKTDLYRINLNLANAKSNQKEFEKAIELYKVAHQIEQEIRPGSPSIVINFNLGNLYSEMGDIEAAESYFEQSLSDSKELNVRQGIYYNNWGFGNLYYQNERYEEAINHLEIANQVALELQNIQFLQNVRELLYKTYKEANKYENSLAYLELFKTTADSLFTLEKEESLANLENTLALDRQTEINRILQEKQVQQEAKLQFQYILIIAGVIVLLLVLMIIFLMRKRAKEKEAITLHLQEQKAELEEVNEAKDKLFAIVAHDLRSPLTSLKGILYLIRNSALSKEEVRNLTQELEISVQQNIDAMEDLLAWASEQLAGVEMNIEQINIKNIVDDIFSKQSFLAEKKEVELINKTVNNHTVLADKNALRLVLRNIISNSIKFSSSNDKIIVRSAMNDKGVHFEIEDTGIGIPEDMTHKIFNNRSWTREGTNHEKGTGFGLSLTKEFIEKMNGSIRFESQENIGTTFFLTLPKA